LSLERLGVGDRGTPLGIQRGEAIKYRRVDTPQAEFFYNERKVRPDKCQIMHTGVF
jgi:hypothetical protein